MIGTARRRDALPPPARDVEQAIDHLAEHGCARIEAVLEGEVLARLRAAVYAARDADRAAGHHTTFALDHDDGNVRVWNLPGRDPALLALAEHPIAVRLVEAVLGWPALLGNLSANITAPGAGGGVLHADQIFVPEPWPSRPQGLNVVFCLDDFTAANGATRIVPGSHRANRNPGDGQHVDAVPIEAPAGSLLALESRLWHRTGENTTADATRAGTFGWYTRPIYRTQENWFLALPPTVADDASDTLLTLLGWRSEGLGLVRGRSPR